MRFARLAGLAVFALVVALAAAAPQPARAARPVGVISYYESRDLPRLAALLRGVRPPRRARVFVGNYWGSPRRRGGGPQRGPALPRPDRVLGPRYRYAPMLPIARGTFWEGRRLSKRTEQLLAQRGDGRYRGRIPSLHRLRRRSPAVRLAYGRELGRRFRDRVRSRTRAGWAIAAWQFDEITTEAAGRRGRPQREFIRGVLQGLGYGRPALRDRKMRGFVYLAPGARRLTRMRGGEARRFWRTVDRVALRLVGEEYPSFTGSPRAAARRQSGSQRSLRRAGGSRRALARRYIVGMTPGHRRGAGLGGNVRYRPRHHVNSWRRAYVRRRARMGASGFGQFNFTGSNSRRRAMRDALRAMAVGLRRVR